MKHALRDGAYMVLSVVATVFILEVDTVGKILAFSEGIKLAGSFIGGLFFTSIFTTVPAIAVLGRIGLVEHPFLVALLGAGGAVLGDLIIFHLFRDHISHDIESIADKIKFGGIKNLSRSHALRWFAVVVGALIISSPLPDELGIAMMGLSKIESRVFMPISFTFNFIGILALVLAARLIVN